MSHLPVHRPLHKGHSGSVVYVIHKITEEYLRLGQLVGQSNQLHKNENTTVYQAIVLQQALDEFEEHWGDEVGELTVLGQNRPGHKSDAEVKKQIDSLRTVGHAMYNAPSFPSLPSMTDQSALLTDSGVGESQGTSNLTRDQQP